ncbi:MAG: MmgE/PrpD family protein, partial [Burkholderiales bacterium]
VTPRDTMGAQFSIPYCAALALAGDPADPAMFAPDAIDDSARREIAKRVEIVVDPEMEAAYPRHYGARVDLELANGERRGSKVLDPHGMPADPCTERERLDKFSRLASRVKSVQSITEIVRRVQSAEQLRSAREIGEMLRE